MTMPTMSTATPVQFLFIDAGVAHIESLLANVDPSIQVVRLTADEDGLTQIARALSGQTGVDAVHVVSHGGPGALTLGSGGVDAGSLDSHADALATIRAALTDSADLLLYGCNIAEGAAGRAFIEKLADLTGADVAASTDPTGSALLGGNWDLEAHTGTIEAAPLPIENYDGLLGPDSSLPSGLRGNGPWTWGGYSFQTKYDGEITDSDPENPLRAGNKWDRYALNGVTAGTRVYVYMGNSSTVDDFLQIDRNGTIVAQDDDSGDGERSYDAFVTWIYQPGDVIRATTYSSGYRGTYSLYIGTSTGTAATPTDIGNAPAPAPPPATAPTFTDSYGLLVTYNDTGATDTFSNTSGSFTATDSTPTGTMTFSNTSGAGTYGTLAVASNGSFVYTPNAAAINAMTAGQTATDTFTIRVTDGGLSTTKQVTVNLVGANDAPTLSSDAAIPAVLEDVSSAANHGQAVSALFAPRFADVDNGASLGGIVIVGDASSGTQGAWEYSTDGGTTWHAVGAVSTTSGLALAATARVRFAPAADWNGTPGSLTVHGADNAYGGGYSSGSTRVTFDTTNDPATSGVSAAGRAISTSVTAVNDAPTFINVAPTHSVTETAGADDTSFASANTVTGTLSGDDIDSPVGSLAFSIRGGTLSAGVWTQTGLYGTLTLDATTHAWTYVPNKFVAINALSAGETAHDVFQFRVTDSAGAYSLQTFDVTFTGTNDLPELAAQIADQVFAGGGTWRYQVPAGTFTDAEGGGLTYTVEVLDGADNVIDTITGSIGGNASLPSSWLVFDEATRTFSGNPTATWNDAPVRLRVTATDPDGASVSDTFDLTLSGTANQPPVVANPLSWQTVNNHHETVTLQLSAGAHGSTIVFDGHTYTVPSSPITGSDVATAVAGGSYANWTAATTGQADTVRFTASVAGPMADLSASDFTGSFASGAVTLTKITEGAASQAETGVRENFRVQLDFNFGGPETLVFDGTTYNIPAAATPDDVAQAILNQGNTANWAVSSAGPGELTFTYRASGNQPDVSTNDFTGGYVTNNGAMLSVNNYVQGSGTPFVPAVAEVWEVTFGADEGGSTVVFDGTTVTAGTPATAADVAAAIVAGGSTANYDVVAHWSDPDTVVFIATNPGVQPDVTGADFTGSFNGTKTVTTLEQGGWSYTFPANTFSDPEGGALTYTAWLIDGAGNATQILTGDGDTSIDFNPATRTLSGDGSAIASNLIEFRATDTSNLSASTRMALYIDDGQNAVPLAVGAPVDSSSFVFDAGTHSFQLPADAFVYAQLGGSLTFIAQQDDFSPLPAWLSFDPTTGVFSGNPPHGATSPRIIVTAVDTHGNTAQTSAFTLNVGTPNDPLVLVAPIADQAVVGGALWSQNFSAPFSNPDGNADGSATSTGGINYTATANGQSLSDFGLTLTVESDGSLTFNGNPSAAAPYLVIVVTGTEASGGTTATTSFTLSLNDANSPQSLNANNPGTVTITGTPTEGQTLSVASVTDADGLTGTPHYQWQVSSDSGSTWQDITGARGQASTLTLAESESGKQVRLQVFYNDDGGVAESPVSNAVSVANLDTAGSVAISGILTPGETITASIADGDGVLNATPTYQWYRDGVAITGATYSAYTLTNADGGAHIRVDVSYTDDHGTAEARSYTTPGVVQLGIVAPVAVNDFGTAVEASGVNNNIPGINPTGNLLANDYDVNNNIDATTPIQSVRAGGVEGVGDPATLSGNTYTIAGQYGTLTVNRTTGAWSYTVDQSNPAVDALAVGQSIQDAFNYTIGDDTGLFDTAVLTVTINGANDSPTLSDVPPVAEFTEDIAEAIRTSFSLVDPDGGTGPFSLRLTVTQGMLRGENLQPVAGVTVTGTDTSVLTISAPSMASVQAWLINSNLLYTSAPNQHGNLNATLTYSVSDDGGSTFRDAGTTALNVESANNPPVVDVGGNGTVGNDYTTMFRPRGSEVAIVASNMSITDIDAADTLSTATVTLTSGAYDNDFGTLYETLRSTSGTVYQGSLGEITISGNGTTQLVLTGTGTHADYEAALKTIVYNNSNPNAFSGERSITISVSDADGAASNTASFATATPNNTIAVGQRIFLNGADTGYTVGQVIDNQHFVASGPLAGLAPGVSLAFWAAGAQVTTATQAGPVIATTTVDVTWTPVIDMSGELIAGRNHEVTYTEGAPAVAIATADASITDQDGNIASVVVTLANHPDGSSERLTITSQLVSQLSALGITVTGNNSHQVTLTGNRDASYFQIGLRGVRYVNDSDTPDVTDRTVNVTSTDMDGHTGVGAATTIHLQAVNDAPHGTSGSVLGTEDQALVIHAADFGFTDVESDAFLAVTISSLPAAGSLTLNGVAVTAGQSVLRSEIDLGHLVYTPVTNASGSAVSSFTFRVQDNGGTARGGVDLDPTARTLTINLNAANDAPVLSAAAPHLATIGENDTANLGQLVSDFVGSGIGKTGITDVDTLNNGGAGNSPEGVGQGIAIHGVANLGPASGGAWQYSTDGGATWNNVGTVSDGSALLLGATDRIRFLPDAQNATEASFSYYAWDGASGTAGTKVDASTRGGSTAFSTAGDTATIAVTAVNDAPTLDLNGASGGTGYTSVFRPRGDAVHIVGSDVSIGDPDMLDAGTPDTISSATISLTGGALDNQFGTIYETLTSTAGTSYNGITISGNGSDTITLTGIASRADYEAALRTIVYQNANPNAFTGDRTIEISVRDTSVSTGNPADRLDSNVAIATVQVPWTPVVDLNGDASAGRNHTVTFTERMPGVAIAASDASIVDQDGNIQRVTVTLTNPLDGSHEKLFISSQLVTQLSTVGITVTGNDSHTLVLSGNRDGSAFQLALRAIRYVNDSQAPSATARVVSVETLDMQNHTGVGATTTINIVTIDDAPVGINNTVALTEDTAHAFTVGEFTFSDAEGHALVSVIVSTLPAAGTLTLNGVAVTAGQEVAVADIAAGHLVYTPVPNANNVLNAAPTFTFQVRDSGGTANGGANLDATPNTLTLNIVPVNDLPTGTVTTDAPSVSISGNLREGQTLTANFDIADVDATPSDIVTATSYQWQTRTVPNGTWTDIAGATANLHVLGSADVNLEIRVVVSYADTQTSTLVYTSDISTSPAIVGDVNGDITLNINTPDPVLIVDPTGDVTITNTGHGPVTVDGMPHGGTLTVDTLGPVTVSNPDGDLDVINNGPGTVTVTGLDDGATLTTGGTGPTTVNDPEGSLDLVNHGPGTVTVESLNDGETLNVSGNGPTTVSNPDGDLTVHNAGPGTVTVTGLNDDATLTTGGNGPTTVSDPEGDLTIVNAGPGTVTVTHLNDGSTLTTSGNGPTTLSDPDGAVNLVNQGPGTVTITGLNDDAPVTVNGTGPTVIGSPDGDVVLHLNGTGTTTVTGLPDDASVTVDGSGPLVIDQPVGDVNLHHTGTGPATVSQVADGATVTVGGSGPTTVSAPLGDVTVRNNGTGLVTTSGVTDGATVTIGGTGPQALDLTGLPPGGDVFVNNVDGANVSVLHAPDGATVHSTGSGDVTVLAPLGDIALHNSGTGTMHLEQVADGATVTKTGAGPAVIDHAAGSFTLVNDDTGLVTVRHVDNGETVTITGTGPVAIESNLAAGERITIDTTGNSNVQISNTGAGIIDVVGDLQLDAGDPMHLLLNGSGTTVLTVAGGVSLTGVPLNLQLDAAYAPHLGDTITLIDNDGTDAITGHFAGLPEGAPLYVGGVLFRISYVGGTGNDVVLTRVNDGPAGAVAISGTPTQGQTLTASHTLTDTDGLGTVRYQWMVNGTIVAVGSTYVLSQSDVGHAVTVVAEYADSEGTVESVASTATSPVANINDAPTGQVLVSGNAMLGQTLIASNTLADLDGMGTVSYQWQADGVNIAGATGASHVLGRADIGHAITVVASYTDGYGAAERVVSGATSPVADGNGVAPTVEQQVPGLGSSGVQGDGNGDGIQDSLQPAVVSAALDRTGQSTPSFVTLVVDSVNGKPAAGTDARLIDFAPAHNTPALPSWAQAPVGEIGFTAEVGAAGVTRNFSLYVDPTLGVNGYWTRNAEGVLVNLASEAHGGRMVMEGDKLRLDFQITEGGEFDKGPAGDTTIVSEGAAAHASLSLIGYTIDTPAPVNTVNIWD